MKMPPIACRAASTAARTPASSPTSAAKPRTCSGSPSIVRSSTLTSAPRSPSRVAVARPIPDAPPVTRADRPPNSLTECLRPDRTLRVHVLGQRLCPHRGREAGGARRLVAAVTDDDRVDEVLVQVVDVLDDPVVHRGGDGHV